MTTQQKLTAAQRREIGHYSVQHYNGWGDGSGYPGKSPNPACEYVGHPLEFSCADGVTMNFGRTGHPLRSLQAGMPEGYDNCHSAYVWGQQHKAIIKSWKAQVGDVLLIDTGGGSQPGHTETIYKITGGGATRRIFSVGWDSGPSNVDGHRGQGGVHLHVWDDPEGRGNPAIMAVLDADRIVDFSKIAKTPAGKKAAEHKKYAPSKLTKDTTSKIVAVEHRLARRQSPVKATGGERHLLRRLIARARRALHRGAKR